MTVEQLHQAFNSDIPHDANVNVIVGTLTISAINDLRVWEAGPDPDIEPNEETGVVPLMSLTLTTDAAGNPIV